MNFSLFMDDPLHPLILNSVGLPGTLHNLATIRPEMSLLYVDDFGDEYRTHINYSTIASKDISVIVQKIREWLMDVSKEYRMWGQWPLWLDEPDMNYG